MFMITANKTHTELGTLHSLKSHVRLDRGNQYSMYRYITGEVPPLPSDQEKLGSEPQNTYSMFTIYIYVLFVSFIFI